VIVGFPEQFPIPPAWAKLGYQKVVCRSAAEVDSWDKKLREQEKRESEMTYEQREAVEGPIRAYVRQELQHKMATSRNAINREFCRQALQKLDDDENRRRMKRESFMHIVGFEDGK
jgi:transketolase